MEYSPIKPSEQILIVTEDTDSFNIFINVIIENYYYGNHLPEILV